MLNLASHRSLPHKSSYPAQPFPLTRSLRATGTGVKGVVDIQIAVHAEIVFTLRTPTRQLGRTVDPPISTGWTDRVVDLVYPERRADVGKLRSVTLISQTYRLTPGNGLSQP